MAIEDRSYVKNEVASFLRTSEIFGAFSNMHSGFPMEISGLQVPSTEAFYQAMKFPHLPDFQQEILDQKTPVLSKRHAYKMQNDTRPDWFKVNIFVMRHALELRCAFYPSEMHRIMMESDGKPIVEISSRDDFWGTFDRKGLLQGKNVLGRLWMERRAIHLEAGPDTPRRVTAPKYPDARLCGRELVEFTPSPHRPAQPAFDF